MDQIVAIVPVFNRVKETIACLGRLSLLNTDSVSVDVVVVDDGSQDHTSQKVKQDYPDTVIIEGDGNLWWAGGVNAGFEYVQSCSKKYDYILILNDDTVFDSSALRPLFDVVKNCERCVCASLVMDEESGRVYSAGQKKTGVLQTLRPLWVGEENKPNQVLACDTVGTRFVLMPTRIIDDVGFFDAKKFPQGYSDFEYFLRAGRVGYQIFVHSGSVVKTRQNANYLNRLLLGRGLLDFLKSFFDMRYGHNLTLLYHKSFADKNLLLGFICLMKDVLGLSRWVAYKAFLSHNRLERIVKSKWKV